MDAALIGVHDGGCGSGQAEGHMLKLVKVLEGANVTGGLVTGGVRCHLAM